MNERSGGSRNVLLLNEVLLNEGGHIIGKNNDTWVESSTLSADFDFSRVQVIF